MVPRSVRGYILLVSFLSLFTSTKTVAQDPLKVAVKNYKLLLENDRVRVLEARVAPGEKVPKHSHPANVTYTLQGGKAKFATPDGKTIEAELKAGEASWADVETHSPENVGSTEIRVLIVELKAPMKKGTK